MYSLFIDTASFPSSILLFNDERDILDQILWENKHTEFDTLIENIDRLILHNNITYTDIKKILCIVWPGSFTGIRVTTLVANSLGYSFWIPLYPITIPTFFDTQWAPYPRVIPLTKSEVILWKSFEQVTPDIVKIASLDTSKIYSTNQSITTYRQDIKCQPTLDYQICIKNIDLIQITNLLTPIYARDAHILLKK